MAQVDVTWQVEDGARHNFSPASIPHAKGLYVASAPCADLPGWGMGETDIDARMMSLTSWLDLLCQCKIKHVLCLMGHEEAERKFGSLGDGGLEKTVRGQGLSYAQVAVSEEAGAPLSPADLAAALRTLRALKPSEESVVIICRDGRSVAAAVAASWLILECGQAMDTALSAVADSAQKAGAWRTPLEAFENSREAFSAALAAANT
ncbi:1a [Symbiodinium natans]|uniref:1a protein n=1 Tax=Symbiodinium natans TaxID=878477 RepID=A0A812LBF7_9DINO|nr:1a [Symbiodinium natans]